MYYMQGCSNIRFGEFGFSKRHKIRFEFDSCEFEFELPFCDSIRANLPRENLFMNYSRKRSNIREQFVGIRCKVGLLVKSLVRTSLQI
jgi:hypothetical protein